MPRCMLESMDVWCWSKLLYLERGILAGTRSDLWIDRSGTEPFHSSSRSIAPDIDHNLMYYLAPPDQREEKCKFQSGSILTKTLTFASIQLHKSGLHSLSQSEATARSRNSVVEVSACLTRRSRSFRGSPVSKHWMGNNGIAKTRSQ